MHRQILGVVLLAFAAGCGGILPHESSVDTTKFLTYEQVMASYNGIDLGKTHRNDLTKLGLDTRTTPNIELLSYSDIVDHFMPSETMKLEQVPANARRCMEAQDHCAGYVIQLQHSSKQRNGGVVSDILGTERDTVSNGWSAKIVLLLQDDVVVYKEISGRPYIEEHHNSSQPLGPLQDLGKNLGSAATP